MTVGGIVLIVVAVLFFLAAAVIGYFSWSNFGAAERLAVSLPEGAEFVVAAVRSKAQSQLVMAGGGLGGSLLFGISGLLMVVLGRRKR